MKMHRKLILASLLAMVAACGSNPPAPVIDRQPSHKPSPPSPSTSAKPPSVVVKPLNKSGDWRPSTYTVKKGDTLFGIGLEYGFDYKDLAAANNIPAPYNIKIGQVIKLEGSDDKVAEKSAEKTGVANSDGVVTYPINGEPNVAASPAQPPKTSGGVVVLNEPKAIREPYSDKALEKAAIVSPKTNEKTAEKTAAATDKTAAVPSTGTKPDIKTDVKADAKPDSKPDAKTDLESTDDIDWAWPTKGKILANFNESSNKGLDIAGTSGQTITAAAPGKVIYSGSDLRGYGKLVIIKHNKNYLSVYAHNSSILVKEGQQVSRGQKISEMGNTDSDAVKLHFEIRRQGKSVDPSKYLSTN